ncbi:THAP domain-containing protein 9 [Elysia marginata]|uniref:THAP domain-containing protein 9 n=1 Tax=Elysia marginata TaxID=1093978 RepID=A0AAV4FU61_9GAST|nr:THAP domain-containing protein 9 [Elysia marginata]
MDRTSQCCVHLKEDAVPSVFDAFPSYLKTVKANRKAPKNRASTSAQQEQQNTVQVAKVIPVDHSYTSTSEHLSPPPQLPSPEVQPVSQSNSNPSQLDSPEKASLKRKLEETNSKLSQSKKKIKTLQQTKRRLLKREEKLTSIIANLRSKNVLSTDSLSVLETCGSGIGDLLKRCEAKSEGKGQPAKYSAELRSFALTLHFYSPKAYAYVRKAFDTCLSHLRTIKKWYETVEDGPGFDAASFQLLQSRVEALQRNGKVAPCALIMDEMAIRQHTEWDGTKYQGYIDMGTQMDNDSLPVAKEALAFMLVSLNDSWKVLLGYFLIAGLNGEERKSLVNSALEKLHDIGVYVVSLTHDGAASNFAMPRSLGVDLNDPSNIKPHFPHPCTDFPVVVFLDPCHMLKLVRNTPADKGVVYSNTDLVKWQYFLELNKLQEKEGLHLGNKLRGHMLHGRRKK